jgi:hypothetical protein
MQTASARFNFATADSYKYKPKTKYALNDGIQRGSLTLVKYQDLGTTYIGYS